MSCISLFLSTCPSKYQSFHHWKQQWWEIVRNTCIDNKFSFAYHVNRICGKATQKLHALPRIAKYISKGRKRTLLKSFIISQFNYCPIVWTCHGRHLSNKIINLHEKALRIVCQNKKVQFRNFIKTWQIYVNSNEKPPIIGYWVKSKE